MRYGREKVKTPELEKKRANSVNKKMMDCVGDKIKNGLNDLI